MPNSNARMRFFNPLDLDSLSQEFTEARILRLAATKPKKLLDVEQARQIIDEVSRLRRCLVDHSIYGPSGYGYTRGWGMHGRVPIYVTTNSRIVKFDLLIEDLKERLVQLESEERQKAEALRRSREAAEQFVQVSQDEKLAGALWHALETAPPTLGFIYLKCWKMPDDSCWYKVGITNNPDRRETEQNVLPVAAETIVCVDVGSMDRARAIESVIHQVLEERRIKDANNRELFHLSTQQASAVKAVLEKLL